MLHVPTGYRSKWCLPQKTYLTSVFCLIWTWGPASNVLQESRRNASLSARDGWQEEEEEEAKEAAGACFIVYAGFVPHFLYCLSPENMKWLMTRIGNTKSNWIHAFYFLLGVHRLGQNCRSPSLPSCLPSPLTSCQPHTTSLHQGSMTRLILPDSRNLSDGFQGDVRRVLYRKTFQIIKDGYHEPTAVMVLSFAIDFWQRVCRSCSRRDVLKAWYEETESDLTPYKVGLALLRMGFKHCSSYDSSDAILSYYNLLRTDKIRADIFLAECLLLEHIGIS